MLDPIAILELDDATVTTPDGERANVQRIAAWDWMVKNVDGESIMKIHTNSGDMYVKENHVDNITEFGKLSGSNEK